MRGMKTMSRTQTILGRLRTTGSGWPTTSMSATIVRTMSNNDNTNMRQS